MNEFTIDVSEVEGLQMTSSLMELEQMFTRAHSTVVQGGSVVLVRKNGDGVTYKFEEITTEADLGAFKEKVFKYL